MNVTPNDTGVRLVIINAPDSPMDPAMTVVQELCDRMLAIVNEAPAKVPTDLMMTAVRYVYTTVAQAFGYDVKAAVSDVQEGFRLIREATDTTRRPQ